MAKNLISGPILGPQIFFMCLTFTSSWTLFQAMQFKLSKFHSMQFKENLIN